MLKFLANAPISYITNGGRMNYNKTQHNSTSLYVNNQGNKVFVFPPFGRYYLVSGENALGLTIELLSRNVTDLERIVACDEETAILYVLEAA
jgi:hypothetical protein